MDRSPSKPVTCRAPGFDIYLRQIGRRSLLTAEQERELGRGVRAGCEQARDELIEANLRLVVRVARRFLDRGLELPDLVAEGNVGLIRAAQKFDPDAGCRFSTYAVWWITQAMRRALERMHLVHVPAGMRSHASAWQRAEQELTQELGRVPAELEVGRHLRATLARRESVRAALLVRNASRLSVEAPVPGEDQALRDILPDRSVDEGRDRDEHAARQEQLHGLLAQLDERSMRILELRFGLGGREPLTLVQTGALFGLTRERVRQLQQRALLRLAQLARDVESDSARSARRGRAA